MAAEAPDQVQQNDAAATQGGKSADAWHRRRLVGTVTSNRMAKTVVVQVRRRVRDKHFHKFMIKQDKYKAHDESNEYKVGDKVEIIESRPLSRDKRWRVTKLIERPAEV